MLKANISFSGKTVLITGVAGFIGSKLAEVLLNNYSNLTIIGIDSMTDYYDVALKEDRLNRLKSQKRFSFIRGNIADKSTVEQVFKDYSPTIV